MGRKLKYNKSSSNNVSGLKGWEKKYLHNTDKYAGNTKSSRREYYEVSSRR